MSKRVRVILICSIVAVVAALFAGGLVYRHTQKDHFPATIRSQLSFPLYYPASLPAGWHVDGTSYTVNDGVLFYRIAGPSTSVIVTVQARPAGLDPQSFYSQQMTTPAFFDTPVGDGAVGTAGTRLIGSMLGTQSWAILSPTTSDITQHTLREIIMALRP